MREFFKYVFATVLGVFISLGLFLIVVVAIIVGLVSSLDSDTTVDVSGNSVLYLNLDQAIIERTPNDKFSSLPLVGSNGERSIGFNDIIQSLKKAKTDDKIDCIYLSVSSPNAGFATMREIREALIDFKTSGKN